MTDRQPMTLDPPVTDHLHVTLDAEPHLAGVARLATRRWLAALHWPESSTAELVFAIGEAVGNSIEHAYREPRPGRSPSISSWRAWSTAGWPAPSSPISVAGDACSRGATAATAWP